MNRLFLLTAALLACQTSVCLADDSDDILSMDLETLLSIEVAPSADASEKGLSPHLPGGQVASGGRVGFLGSRPLLQAPFSVTSYTHAFMQQQQAASIGDVLQFDPSVRVTRGFGNFQQAYMIRGMPVFSDDMAYNGLYGMLPRQYLAAELVERIEILRGPNSFLNGAAPNISGVGGAVNVMPKRAPKEDLNLVSLGTQSGGQTYTAADLARRSPDKRSSIRMNAVNRYGKTAVDNESRQLNLASFGTDFHGDDLRVSIEAGIQDHDLRATMPSINIDAGLAIPDAPESDSAIAQQWTYSDEQDHFGNLRAEFDFNDNITAWVAGGVRVGEEQSSVAAFLSVSNDAGDFDASRFDVDRKDDVKTAEVGIRVLTDLGGISQQFSVSANTYSSESRNAYILFSEITSNLYHPVAVSRPSDILFTGGEWGDPDLTTAIYSSSIAFAHETAWIDDTLRIIWGARSQSLRELNYDYNSGARTSEYDEQAIAPGLGLVYAINPRLATYFNYTEGLLKGDTAPASNANGAVTNAGETLEPYHVEQIEAGIKFATDIWGASVAVFEIHKPIAGYNANNSLIEKDTQRNRGLESSLYGEPTTGLRILAGASWLETKVENNNAIGTPRLQGNMNLEWDIPGSSGLTLATQLIYTGEQYANADNTQEVPAWRRIDLGARYLMPLDTKQTLTMRIRIENVENRDYWASSGGYPGEGYLTLSAPRSVIFSTDINF